MIESAFTKQSHALMPTFASPGSDLNAYISSVHQFPLLSAERELELASRLQKDQDLEAARELKEDLVTNFPFIPFRSFSE